MAWRYHVHCGRLSHVHVECNAKTSPMIPAILKAMIAALQAENFAK